MLLGSMNASGITCTFSAKEWWMPAVLQHYYCVVDGLAGSMAQNASFFFIKCRRRRSGCACLALRLAMSIYCSGWMPQWVTSSWLKWWNDCKCTALRCARHVESRKYLLCWNAVHSWSPLSRDWRLIVWRKRYLAFIFSWKSVLTGGSLTVM